MKPKGGIPGRDGYGRKYFVHFLDGAFLNDKAERFHDLECLVKEDHEKELVIMELTRSLRTLALLPEEALQLADSLREAAELATSETEAGA